MSGWPDLVNATFEICGAVPISLSVRRLWRDKVARGISPYQFGFFGLWGLWNLIFYPMLDQWFSLLAGLLLTGTNLLWLVLYLWFRRQSAVELSSARSGPSFDNMATSISSSTTGDRQPANQP